MKGVNMSISHVVAAGAGARVAREARRRREAASRRGSSNAHQGKSKQYKPTYKEETITKEIGNGWTIEETLRDGELFSSCTRDENKHVRERKHKINLSGIEGFEIDHYDEQERRHGEHSFITLDGEVLEREFYNQWQSNGDGLHFSIHAGIKRESLYSGGKLKESAEYYEGPNSKKGSRNWMLARKYIYNDNEGEVYRESYRFNPHYYMDELSKVLDGGGTLHQKFNPDKSVALSEKYDAKGNLIEYIVDGQDKLAEKLQELEEEKLAQEQYKREIEAAKQKRMQEREAKARAVTKHGLKIRRQGGRTLVSVMKGLRDVGLLKTVQNKKMPRS